MTYNSWGDLLECPHDDIMPDLIDLMGEYQTSRYPDMNEVIPCEYDNEAIARDRVRKAQKVFAMIYGGELSMNDPVIDVFRTEILPKIESLQTNVLHPMPDRSLRVRV